MDYLSPKLDIVFKKAFGDVNNADMLRGLVSAYLGVDTSGRFELSNTEITPEELERKFARLDLRISTENSEIDIEVQVVNRSDYMDRCLYYWASLYASMVPRSGKYISAKQTLMLNILDFSWFKCDDFNTNFTFYDPKNKLTLSDKARISFIELPKIRSYTKEEVRRDERVAWAAFFNAKTKEEFDMLSNTTDNTNVQKAITVIRQLSADERVREEARKREDALYSERSALHSAKAEGIAAEQARMIANLRELGVPENVIKLAASGKSIEETEDNSDEEDMDFEP